MALLTAAGVTVLSKAPNVQVFLDLGTDVATLGAAALRRTPVNKWDQPPQPGGPGPFYFGWNEPSMYAGPQIAADDWLCTNADPIVAIRWWGSFLNWRERTPPEPMPTGFHLTIWSDVPAGIDAPFSHPGVVLWQATVSSYRWELAGWDFDPTLPLVGGIYRAGEPIWWPSPDESWDVAFRLSADCIRGDVNYDGLINGDDIQWFVGVLLGDDVDPARFCASDMNVDNRVDALDVPLFVDALLRR